MKAHTGFRILLVDDEEDNLFLLKAFLESDYRVDTATSGENGLVFLGTQEVDLMIVDQRMPGIDGLTFCEKASLLCPNSIRIMLTAFSDREMLLAAIAGGKIFRVLTKPWDFIELKAAIEEAFQKLAYQRAFSSLIQELHEKNAQLELSYQQLKEAQEARLQAERLSAVGQVTARMLHEMSNQLTVLVMLKSMREQIQTLPNLAKPINFVIEATENLYEMVQLLRQFTKGQPPTLKKKQVNVRDIIERSVRFLEQSSIAKGVQFLEEYEDVGEGYFDELRIKQVVLNLLRNGIQALHTDRRIWISLHKAGHEEVLITVRDAGHGIPSNITDKIFQPFFTTKSHQGLGLGLDVCKQIIDNHQGRISFESVVGKGPRFGFIYQYKNPHKWY